MFINSMEINQNHISFQAKLGNNAVKIIKKEFNDDTNKVQKFERLFADTFEHNIDSNTVVDIDKNRKYVFSNSVFPDIRCKTDVCINVKDTYSKALLQECPKTLLYLENKLFRTVIAKSIKSGKSFEELENLVSKFFRNVKSKKYFLENLSIAKLIKEENPKSQLKDYEFDYMNIQIMEKEANTEGSELYNMIHNFQGLQFK